MKKPETILQQKIKSHLKNTYGGVWHKIHGDMYQDAGIGDLIGCLYGYYFNLEVKLPTNKKRKEHQTLEINNILMNGGCGAYVTSVEEADKVVRSYLKNKIGFIPEKSSEAMSREKILCTMDGSRNRKNTNIIKTNFKFVEE